MSDAPRFKNPIVRSGENLLTGFRAPGELWTSRRQPLFMGAR